MATAALYDQVVAHLGGEARLKDLGARVYATDDAHVSVKLLHPNPCGVRSVTITARPGGLFAMDCFGPFRPDSFSAPIVGSAEEVIPDNLATVLGRLTGVEALHHRHY